MLCSGGNQHFPSAMASHHHHQFQQQHQQQQQEVITPHDHDVLSGRGNFVNYHAGNEHFRALVRKHKVAYVACPKPQKSKFSRMIVEEIRNRNPPGRFLKQDNSTKLWYDIGEKKALDKTRQALREGAPEIMKELSGDDSGDEGVSTEKEQHQQQQALQPQTLDTLELPPRLPSINCGVEARPQAMHNLPIDPSLVNQTGNQMLHPGQFVHSGQFVQSQQSVTTPYDDFASQDAVGMLSNLNVAPQIVLSQHQNGIPSNRCQPSIDNGNDMLRAYAQTHSQQQMTGFAGNNNSIRSSASLRQAMQQQEANQQQANHQQIAQQQQSSRLSLASTGLSLQGHRLSYQDVDSVQTRFASLPHLQEDFHEELEPRPIGPMVSLQFEPQAPPPLPPPQQQNHQQQTYDGGEARLNRVPSRRVPVRMPRRQGPAIERDGSERSLKMDGVFGGGGSQNKDHDPRSGMDSGVSIMSLSIGDIVHKMSGDDFAKNAGSSNDPDDLAPLFDSSVRLTATVEKKRTPLQRTNSSDGTSSGTISGGSENTFQGMGKSMDMSMATLGDRMSDFGESAARMTESQADMSFANVFEEEDDVYGGDEGHS